MHRELRLAGFLLVGVTILSSCNLGKTIGPSDLSPEASPPSNSPVGFPNIRLLSEKYNPGAIHFDRGGDRDFVARKELPRTGDGR
jgi:hypothetical protein